MGNRGGEMIINLLLSVVMAISVILIMGLAMGMAGHQQRGTEK